ncbi:hypothetical protein [Hymenobacter lucidus]|uniref:Uncharacterized protein n=1 Tax=Hymenobacter lucidus TaxID=2880930 RepID=A0ABS8AN87_9BACT|nr:hypothetical protein [Hymenobacter lucidus]MCB2407224.1 hypothetical protein [Hymenobacter lucidus]
MSYLLVKRRQGYALHYLLLEMAARRATRQSAGCFQTLDGELISYPAGQVALRTGAAMLIGGLLVGIIPSEIGGE